MVILGLALWVVLACGLIQVFFPSSARGYFIGAFIASAAWWMYCLMITTCGLAGKLAGINAEVSTAAELRRLCKSGWRLMDRVMLDHRDVDHVLLGPSGFFTVETKFRSSWRELDRDLTSFAATASENVDEVWLRLGLPRTRVQALVVLCGGGIDDLRPPTFDVGDTTFCTALGLRAYLGTFVDGDVTKAEVAGAYAKLQSSVRTPDRAEAAVGAEIRRQVVGSAAAVMGALVLVISAIYLAGH